MNNSIIFEVNFSKKIAQTRSKPGLFFSFILSHFTAELQRLPSFVNLTLRLAQLLGISSFKPEKNILLMHTISFVLISV
jgi:hypothetical protein